MATAVDEEGRSPGDTTEIRAVDVICVVGITGVLAQRVGEALDIEAELLGVADEIARSQRVLVVEKQVVHLPERVLRRGRFGSLRGELGMRVDVVERQVSPDVADVAEVTQELAQDRFRPPAVGTLEVAVLDHRDRSVEWPADVIALRIDVEVEVDERLDRAEECTYPRAAREQP